MVRRQTWQANLRIGPSLSNRVEPNRDVRFEFESNIEASQATKYHAKFQIGLGCTAADMFSDKNDTVWRVIKTDIK